MLGVSNERMVNIHLNSNRRGSLDNAAFTSDQMQQFINELDAAYRSNRFVAGDTVLSLTAQAARDLITYDMLAHKYVNPNAKESWIKASAPKLIAALRKLYPLNSITRFQPLNERWAAVAARVSSIEAIRLNDAMGPTNNARGKLLVVLVQALAELDEPQSDQIDTLIREIVKGLTASTNEHGRKDGNVRMKELLEKRINHARETATNSARRISMARFIQIVGDLLAEIEKHHNQSAAYGLVPRSTASSNKDSDKSKQGGSKAGGGKDTKSTTCSGCGGTYHTLDKCLFKEHPDFNKSGSWEKSTALTKLKTKYPDDESRHRLNRKYRIDGTPLEKPIDLPKKADKHKGKKGTKVP